MSGALTTDRCGKGVFDLRARTDQRGSNQASEPWDAATTRAPEPWRHAPDLTLVACAGASPFAALIHVASSHGVASAAIPLSRD